MKKSFIVFLLMHFSTVVVYPQMFEQWSSKYNGPEGCASQLSSGNYYYSIDMGSYAETKKMVLLN